ncbi:FRG domain-containing protein [Labrys okinawensis]|uniref:FRG domain-containing protein n=1 Tax=Labrys okinawensis TaxID=346911 RepID=UPI0039BC9BFB
MSDKPNESASFVIDLTTYDIPVTSCDTWEDFEQKLTTFQDGNAVAGMRVLYRGQADQNWPIQTTLERTWPEIDAKEYYRRARNCLTQIEAFTDTKWDIPNPAEISKVLDDYDSFSLSLTRGDLPAYGYLAYLRHHGFPSPLLDWTGSPYVAAYFAFNPPSGRRLASERVAIYAYCRAPKGHVYSSGGAQIHIFGPNVATHRRHYLQKGEYTICFRYLVGDWRFMRHEAGYASGAAGPDSIHKFTIPIHERMNVLKRLDDYNLNSFSLFGSDESLIETMALRETINAEIERDDARDRARRR